MIIGKRIKELRKAKKMTLTDLAEKSGVQIATLSRIENLKMTGTLESHMNIAKALGIELTDLYQSISSGEDKFPVIQGPLETFNYNAGASYEILTNKVMAKKMMPIILRLEPNGRTNPEQNPPDSEKFIFVLEGEVTVHVGEAAYPLTANKTLYFNAAEKHFFANTGTGVARAISVVTPMAL